MTKIPVLSLDPGRYAETFAVFVARSLEYPQMLAELCRVTRAWCPAGYRMLDIGAGTGQVIQALADGDGHSPGHYTAFEPNPRHAEALGATLQQLGLPHQVHECPFSTTTELGTPYDFALFSHSLYWMEDPAATMLHAATAVVPGGKVLAFIAGPYGVHAMFPLFEPLLDRTSPMLQNNAMSSLELVRGLRTHGIEPDLRMLPTPIDLTGLFDPAGEAELDEFISFCLQLEFRTLPAWLKRDIVDYVRGGCVTQDGCLYWYLPTAAVTLPGQCAVPSTTRT